MPLTTASALLAAAGGLALSAAPADAASGSFTCSASGPGVAALGRSALDPASVGSASAPCAQATAGIGDLLHQTPGIDVDAVAASTALEPGAGVRTQVAAASGGVLSAHVGGLGSLGLPLSTFADRVVLPAGLQQVQVALPAPLATALGPVILPLRLLDPALATQLSGLVTNGLSFDTAQLVRDALVLPTADLLSARAITATASARCVDGRVVLAGAHDVAPVTALGQVVDANTPLTQLLPVVGSTIDLSRLDLTQITLPPVLTGLGLDGLLAGALTTVQRSVVAQLQAALPAGGLALPADLVRLDVTPGSEERTATGLTERALRVQVAVAGRAVADVQGGTATVSAAGVDCVPPTPPTTTTAEPPTPTTTAAAPPAIVPPAVPVTTPLAASAPSVSTGDAAPAAQQLLQCSERRLVLTNVLQRPDRVALFGVADRALAGRTVTLRFRASGKDVATAVVAPDGTFEATAPLPSRTLRASNLARYQARIGSLTSLDLKLQRRMTIERIDQAAGRVTLRGRVAGPFPRGGATVLLTRRVSCATSEPVARVKADARGNYVVTAPVPAGAASVVYRLQSKVRRSATSAKVSRTYTLPQGIDVAR